MDTYNRSIQNSLTPETNFTTKKGVLYIDGRNAGHITCHKNGKLTLVTHRKKQQHRFRNYNGYALAKDILEYLQQHKVTQVLIIEDNKNSLLSNVSDWIKTGFIYKHQNYETQYVLPIDGMKQEGI